MTQLRPVSVIRVASSKLLCKVQIVCKWEWKNLTIMLIDIILLMFDVAFYLFHRLYYPPLHRSQSDYLYIPFSSLYLFVSSDNRNNIEMCFLCIFTLPLRMCTFELSTRISTRILANCKVIDVCFLSTMIVLLDLCLIQLLFPVFYINWLYLYVSVFLFHRCVVFIFSRKLNFDISSPTIFCFIRIVSHRLY